MSAGGNQTAQQTLEAATAFPSQPEIESGLVIGFAALLLLIAAGIIVSVLTCRTLQRDPYVWDVFYNGHCPSQPSCSSSSVAVGTHQIQLPSPDSVQGPSTSKSNVPATTEEQEDMDLVAL